MDTIIEIKKDGWDSERATEFVDTLIDDFEKGDRVKISINKVE